MSPPTASESVLPLLAGLFDGGDTLATVSTIDTGRIVAISPGFARLLDMTQEQAIGRTGLDLGLWRSDAERDAVMAPVLENGSSTGQVVSLRAPDGRHFDGLLSCSLIGHAGERLLFSLIQDVRSYHAQSDARRRELVHLHSRVLASEEALRQSESLYRNLVANSRDGVFLMQHGRVEFANEALGGILGCPAAELIGNNYFEWIAPEDRAVQGQRRAAREAGSDVTQLYEVNLLRRDGARRLCEVRAGFVEYRGEPASIGTLRDVTEARAQQRLLAAAEERYRLLFQHAVLGMFQTTLDGQLLEANEAMARMFGFDSPQALRTAVPQMRALYVEREDRAQVIARLLRDGSAADIEIEFLRRDGSRFWALASARLVLREEPGRIEGSLIDISARRAAEQELKFLAHHDSLTGLANRHSFELELREALAALQAGAQAPRAMLLLDLDRFKLVNDSLGHAAGDELLVKFGQALFREFGAGMRIARYGGDEFALLSCARMDRGAAVAVARRIAAIAAQPWQVHSQQVFCGVSLGIVLLEDASLAPEAVMRDADIAMYRAKARGGGHAIFDVQMHAAVRERLALETELRFALARGEMQAHYQPIVRVEDRRVIGVETLVRWQHPSRGLLLPAAFLAAAEEAGLLPAIDLAVLGQALRQLPRWRALCGERAPRRISVNISDRLFASPEFPTTLRGLLADCEVEPAALQLEITEGVFRSSVGSLRSSLAELKALGVRLVVDDFGTGYSSLVSFSDADFDGLKIDQGFIRDLETNPRHRAIVRTIAQFAQDLGLALVAEGVETEVQAQWLRQCGCVEAQGWLYAPALTPAALTAMLGADAGVREGDGEHAASRT